MKQVLIVGAGQHFPKGPFTFLGEMQQQERIHARAMFFRPVDYSSLAASTAGRNLEPLLELEDNEKELVAAHKSQFARQCELQHIPYSVHENDEQWNKATLIKESRFADLILISGELFFAEMDKNQPNDYLRQALHGAECPVLVIPENFSSVKHLFMAYDGSRESLFAIKQFCYLFPSLTDLPTQFLYVHDDVIDSIPDLESVQQFSRLKFNAMSFSKLHLKAADYFATWISEKQDVMLVSGSFGRSSLSYIGKRSFAGDIIRDHRVPVFIAHL